MIASRNTPHPTQQLNQQQCAAPTQNSLTTNSTHQQQQISTTFPLSTANTQHLQHLVLQQQHQSDGQQQQPTAQAFRQQAPTSADNQQQQSETPVSQIVASRQDPQQGMAQQQQELAGQQRQPETQASMLRASSPTDTQRQQTTPAPQNAANMQHLQLLVELNQHQLADTQYQPAAKSLSQWPHPRQINEQQQHQSVGQQQQQPIAQTTQLRALSYADTQQQNPATHAPPIGGNSLSLQTLAELNQHQLTGQQDQSAAQAPQPRASLPADTQQQQSDIPAPPMITNTQHSPQMDTQQPQMFGQLHQPAAQAAQLRASSLVGTLQQQSPTIHPDRHPSPSGAAAAPAAPNCSTYLSAIDVIFYRLTITANSSFSSSESSKYTPSTANGDTATAPQIAANVQYSQQFTAQQQHQLVNRQRQPEARGTQPPGLTSFDSQQRQSASPALQVVEGTRHSRQTDAQRHELTGQLHGNTTQASQLRASPSADAQQQLFAIPASQTSTCPILAADCGAPAAAATYWPAAPA
ncbi:mediator of RNA polymerase II transcription subunit 15-like [Drosophila tropicalis]|uniref:mediator of RNA polymerase II transcription subunit 15-like n=1 Tax=Drosophila tropicalis TaxID=46794 RepID=UPI0035ABB145